MNRRIKALTHTRPLTALTAIQNAKMTLKAASSWSIHRTEMKMKQPAICQLKLPHLWAMDQCPRLIAVWRFLLPIAMAIEKDERTGDRSLHNGPRERREEAWWAAKKEWEGWTNKEQEIDEKKSRSEEGIKVSRWRWISEINTSKNKPESDWYTILRRAFNLA